MGNKLLTRRTNILLKRMYAKDGENMAYFVDVEALNKIPQPRRYFKLKRIIEEFNIDIDTTFKDYKLRTR